jgi:hypothetical protein
VSNDFSTNQSISINVDLSAKAIAATVKVGVSGGISLGGFFEYSLSTTTTFSGTVGAIPGETFAANQYSWGIFAYQQILFDPADNVINRNTGLSETRPKQNYTVVNYWVE